MLYSLAYICNKMRQLIKYLEVLILQTKWLKYIYSCVNWGQLSAWFQRETPTQISGKKEISESFHYCTITRETFDNYAHTYVQHIFIHTLVIKLEIRLINSPVPLRL